MLRVLNILKKFCDIYCDYNVVDNTIYMYYNNTFNSDELYNKWINSDDVFNLYLEKFVYISDKKKWIELLSRENLLEFYNSDLKEKHFFVRFFINNQIQWHEIYLEKVEDGLISFMSRDVNTLKRNDAVIKAIDPKFDYVTYINVEDQSYILYSSDENESILPKSKSDNYPKILRAFNEMYVAPEEREYSIEAMSLENVIKQLEIKKEYILYITTLENNIRHYKKLRYCYSDSSKQTILLSRIDITELINEQKLRSEEETKITYYLEYLPVAVCMTKVLLDENGEPFDFEYIYSNRAHSELEGVEYGELIGKRFYEYFKEDNPIWLKYYYETAYLGIPHTIDDFSPAINKHLIIHTFPAEYGYCGCAVEDVTEKKFLEKEVRKGQNEILHILKKTADFVFQYDFNEKILYSISDEGTPKFGKLVKLSNYLKKGYAEEKSEQKLIRAIEKIKNGENHVSLNIQARKDLDEPFYWYQVNLSDYAEVETHNRKILGYIKNIDKIVQKQKLLKAEAEKDPLTGVFNVKTGKKQITKRINDNDSSTYNALFVMDLDYFKQINDTFGHMFGDKILIRFSNVLKNTFRTEDIIYRIGGDEFAVFVSNIPTPEKCINNIMKRFYNNLEINKEDDIKISSSVGVFYSNEKINFEEFYLKADKALYESKRNGKQQYCIYNDSLKK